MRISLLASAFIGAGFVAAGPARATTVVSGYDLLFHLYSGGSRPLLIAQFDPARGVLEGVQFSLEAFSGGSMSYYCPSECTQTYRNHTSGNVSILGIDLNSLSERTQTVTYTDVPSGGSFGFGAGSVFDNGEPLSDPTLLAQLSGVGTVASSVSGRAFHTCVGGGSCNTGGAQHRLRLYVAYTFREAAAVPEPATWAMMVAGFGLVGGMMRRKTKASISYA